MTQGIPLDPHMENLKRALADYQAHYGVGPGHGCGCGLYEAVLPVVTQYDEQVAYIKYVQAQPPITAAQLEAAVGRGVTSAAVVAMEQAVPPPATNADVPAFEAAVGRTMTRAEGAALGPERAVCSCGVNITRHVGQGSWLDAQGSYYDRTDPRHVHRPADGGTVKSTLDP